MINSIQNHLYTPATTTPAAPASSAAAASGFSDELGSQLAFPDPRTLFEYTPRGATTADATAAPAAQTSGSTSGSPVTSSSGSSATPVTQPIGSTDNPAAQAANPTAQSVFGDQPWVQDPQGAGLGASWDYNPIYFASQATAQKVADMVGGTVIEQNVMTSNPASPLQQSQPNEMVQLKDGSVVNPGLIADFYDHNYSQSYVNQMIQNEIQGV
jgi:hypothetical protein